MKHPLTDEICYQIEFAVNKPFGQTHAYIRGGADWQLEQVIKWLDDYPIQDVLSYHGEAGLIEELKKAMRPQEDNQ